MAISLRSVALVALVALGQAPGASAQSARADRHSIDQAYAIVDFQTSRSGREIAQALQRHLDRLPMQVTYRQLSVADAPRSPGRFTLVDPTAQSAFGLQGPATRAPAGWLSAPRTVVCTGASWRAEAVQRLEARIEQQYTLCLFPYRDGRRRGHQLNVYASTLLEGDPTIPVRRSNEAESPAVFIRSAVEAVERVTGRRGVWIENRTAERDLPFTQDNDALSAQTN
ncbi:hypothetical protein [Brevundimonas vesicularis]|uniref:hypothetical protein n=1 Tax=Brevundimonas vesicularis TaxID=41276 RepID=UPI0028AE2252|nr:hypothetical protein [Brevundimonas vesicularis]